MHLPDIIRYVLWAGILATANANRRYYRMTTTWLPHLLSNSFTLLLPDLYGIVAARDRQRTGDASWPAGQARPASAEWEGALRDMLAAMVRDNPRYAIYVAPLAVGYLLSHPRFNIYKGDLAEMRLAGFGLDALPHGATAFALTALVADTAHEMARKLSPGGALADALRWGDRHQALLSAAALALATIGWELGEYMMYQSEMAQRGDPAKINMQWSPRDMLYDCAANVVGWGLAVGWRSRFRSA